MRNVLHKNCNENQNTMYVQQLFFSPENFAVYDTIWKNIVEPGTPQMIVWGTLIACWAT